MLFGEDFLSGCRKAAMTPEQVGMYIFMLILEWTDKAPIDDDMKRLSVRTGWDKRICTRLSGELVSLGKYHREEGHLSNDRMQSEIAIFIEKQKAKDAKMSASSGAAVAQLSPSSFAAKPLAGDDLSEKDNENNEAVPEKPLYARASQKQKHIDHIEKDTSPNGEECLIPATTSLEPLEAFGLYNEMAQRCGLALARTLTPQRRKSLTARLREHGGIDAWRTALANVERSAFLRGNNDTGWRADLDFLLTASKFTKVFEGSYGNGAHAKEGEYDRIGRLLRQATAHQQPTSQLVAIEDMS
jgi:uncharacterized protein YdaU (DUF1376 family)